MPLEALVNHLPLSQDSLQALYAMGHEYYRNGKYEQAQQLFRFLTFSDTQDRRFWIALASSHYMLKEYPQAIEAYSISAIQDPSDPTPHWYAANCFLACGQKVKALEALDSALSTAKKDEKYAALIPQIELLQEVSHGRSH